MPSKNIIKQYIPNSYYHVYNRGVEKKDIFKEDIDKFNFMNLFDRYLNPDSKQTDAENNPFDQYFRDIEMQSFCIMSNHYHFLFWVGETPGSLPSLMRAVGTSYTKYYNTKNDRVGPLFQSRYKASLITGDDHLLHISRYIHLNPMNFMNYEYSSIKSFLGGDSPLWLKPQRVLSAMNGNDYYKFLLTA